MTFQDSIHRTEHAGLFLRNDLVSSVIFLKWTSR